jgi:glycosyltransferase involved in cell wall biosynthesis
MPANPVHHPLIDVIIPARNEERSIALVIADIPQSLVRSVFVADNNSADDTAKTAQSAGAIVVSAPNAGYGNACLAAISFLKEHSIEDQPDIVVFLDGDYSDFPQEMHLLTDPILLDKADLVIGSRVLGTRSKGALTPHQIFGNWLATRLIRLIYGYRFTDLGPFRAISWKKLLELDMKDQNYGWTVEMQVKAAKLQFRCVEVPVSYRKRIGKSKVSGTIKGSVLAGYKILLTIFKLI